MKFNVTVQRTEYREHTFLIEADSEDDAWYAGLSAANDHNFGEDRVTEAGEEVTAIIAGEATV
jgi:hypothetical protein